MAHGPNFEQHLSDSRLYGQTLRATIKFKVTWPVGDSGEVPIVAMGDVRDISTVITEEVELKVADQGEKGKIP